MVERYWFISFPMVTARVWLRGPVDSSAKGWLAQGWLKERNLVSGKVWLRSPLDSSAKKLGEVRRIPRRKVLGTTNDFDVRKLLILIRPALIDQLILLNNHHRLVNGGYQ